MKNHILVLRNVNENMMSFNSFRYWDGQFYRVVVGYVGEGGIEAGVAYKLNNNCEIIEAG